MKKYIILISLAVLLICIYGCQVLYVIFGTSYCDSDSSNSDNSSNVTAQNIVGSTYDNPIPFGEYGQIGDKGQNVQLKIKRIYYHNKTQSSKRMVIEFEINAIDLNGSNFSPTDPDLILKNGTKALEYGSVELNGTKGILCITFTLPGSVVTYSMYEDVDLSECLCLRYYNYRTDKCIYFSLQNQSGITGDATQ